MALCARNLLVGLLPLLLTFARLTMAQSKVNNDKPFDGILISGVACHHGKDLHINVTAVAVRKEDGVGFYRYKITTNDNKTYEDISIKPNTIIHDKCLRQCVKISVRYVIQKNSTLKYYSKWSPEKEFCSGRRSKSKLKIVEQTLKIAPVAVLQSPYVDDLKIQDDQIIISVRTNLSTFPEEVASQFFLANVFKDNKTIGSQANFQGRFHFDNVLIKTCLNVSFQTAVIVKKNPNIVVYSTMSSPTKYCKKPDDEHNKDRPLLSTLLSCLIPSITILVLIVGAFVSYYRKKQIEKDLTSSNESFKKKQLLNENEEPMFVEPGSSGASSRSRSPPSSGNSTPSPIPVKLISEDRTRKNSKKGKMDGKLYTTNKKELSRLLSASSM